MNEKVNHVFKSAILLINVRRKETLRMPKHSVGSYRLLRLTAYWQLRYAVKTAVGYRNKDTAGIFGLTNESRESYRRTYVALTHESLVPRGCP